MSCEPIRIPVGNGTPEGTNSAYLLRDARMLVDPGPPSESAWKDLMEGLDAAGFLAEDIEHVCITHWHADHAGLSWRLADRADATVHMHRHDAPLVGEYGIERPRRVDRDQRALDQWGVPPAARDDVKDRDTPSPFPDSFPVRQHEDGDVVAGVEFVHTPGHTAGHTSLRTGEHLLLGDLLLPTYTPNVGGSDTRLDSPLRRYLDSLGRVEGTELTGHPGHGTTLDIDPAIASVRTHHEKRSIDTLDVLIDSPTSRTPWEVATALFGDLTGIHVKFGAGEAAAHLYHLVALDMVEQTADSPEQFRSLVDAKPQEL